MIKKRGKTKNYRTHQREKQRMGFTATSKEKTTGFRKSGKHRLITTSKGFTD